MRKDREGQIDEEREIGIKRKKRDSKREKEIYNDVDVLFNIMHELLVNQAMTVLMSKNNTQQRYFQSRVFTPILMYSIQSTTIFIWYSSR